MRAAGLANSIRARLLGPDVLSSASNERLEGQ
jgi:hypothetical protein